MSNRLNGDRHALYLYIQELASLAGLKEWELYLSDEKPDEEDTGACINVTYGRRHAIIRISPGWPDWSDKQLRDNMLHELIHCHIEPMHWSINNVQAHLGLSAFNIFEGAFIDAMEIAVDNMAIAWATTLPYPTAPESETGAA